MGRIFGEVLMEYQTAQENKTQQSEIVLGEDISFNSKFSMPFYQMISIAVIISNQSMFCFCSSFSI